MGQQWRLGNKTIQKQEEGKNRGPLTALKRMVTTQRKLTVDHLKSHLISGPSKKMERNGINGSDEAKRR
jgi:hypothetical protein